MLWAKGFEMVPAPTTPTDEPENATVVTTINAAGDTLSPLIIFEGQRVEAAWMAPTKEPTKARYSASETSFMEENVFLNYLRDVHQQLGERGFLDGKPHALVLGHNASHVTVEVLQLATELNLVFFKLPSGSLDVASFESFETEVRKVLSCFPQHKSGRTPETSDMVGIIGEAWASSFSKEDNIASFASAGIWPVDAKRAVKGGL